MNKKEFLEEYEHLKGNAEDALMNYESLKNLAQYSHQNYDGIPHAHTNDNVHETLLAKMTDAKIRAEELQKQADEAKNDILKGILSIDNLRLQNVLLMAHIELLSWKEMESRFKRSSQQLQKLRRDGENLITVPSSYSGRRATKYFRKSEQ